MGYRSVLLNFIFIGGGIIFKQFFNKFLHFRFTNKIENFLDLLKYLYLEKIKFNFHTLIIWPITGSFSFYTFIYLLMSKHKGVFSYNELWHIIITGVLVTYIILFFRSFIYSYFLSNYNFFIPKRNIMSFLSANMVIFVLSLPFIIFFININYFLGIYLVGLILFTYELLNLIAFFVYTSNFLFSLFSIIAYDLFFMFLINLLITI